MFSKASFAAVISVAAAQLHAPTTGPAGNAITRPLIEVVPACKPFQITWVADTLGTVSILLLRGPSTNVVPLGAPLVEGYANTGSFTWTPASTLEADVTHYGLQIIDDATGQYQYSPQFGISKDDCSAETSSSIVSSSTSSAVASSSAVESSSVAVSTSSSLPPYPTTVQTVTSSAPAGTGAPAHNATIVQPTGSMTVPVSLTPTATDSESTPTESASEPEFTGAASSIKTGLSLAGAAAFAALML